MSNGLNWTEKQLQEWYHQRQIPPAIRKAFGVVATPAPHKLGRGQRVEIDGIKFASQAEARRYGELKLLQHAGKISGLECHPWWNIEINGVHICRVVADFSYYRNDGEPRVVGKKMSRLIRIVEDIKRERIGKDGKVKFSTDTRHSKIGRKLLLAVHGVVVEVLK